MKPKKYYLNENQDQNKFVSTTPMKNYKTVAVLYCIPTTREVTRPTVPGIGEVISTIKGKRIEIVKVLPV